jgi:MFS family permease
MTRAGEAGEATHPARTPPAGRFDRRLVAPMVLGSVLNPVNSSMLAVALVPIGLALGAPPSATIWLVSALYLATAVGQPVVGRLVDLYGPRRLYLAGVALVGVAGVLGAFAPSLGVLVVARVLLGIGTCAAYPASMVLIRSESVRTGTDSPAGVLAALSAANQTVAVIGPTVGGLLIGLGGWRAIFTVNVPLALACLVLGSLRLPREEQLHRDDDTARPRGLDVTGMALFAATLTALLLFLMQPAAARWPLLLVVAVAVTGLVLRERRAADPFIDVRLLAGNAPLVATYVRQLLASTVSYAFLYGFTQWLEQGRGLTATGAGLALLPMFVVAIAVTTIFGRREQVRGKLLVGGALQVLACLGLLLLHDDSPLWLVVAVVGVVGVPQGLIGLANQNALYRQAHPDRLGSSAGLLRTSMYLGAMVAAAANAAAFPERADTAGLHALAVVLTAVSVLLLAMSAIDRSLGRRRPEPAPALGPDPATPPVPDAPQGLGGRLRRT